MKRVILDNEQTYFYITENGDLFSDKTKNWYKGKIQGGYKVYDLNWKNKRYSKLAHRLVAEAYILNPENLPIVNHKDGNKLNNNVNNLEWVTAKDNLIHAYKMGLKNKSNNIQNREKYSEDLPGEIWVKYKNTNYFISNKGRIRNSITNNLLKGKITKDGYIEWHLTINHSSKNVLAHRIIFEVFNQKEIDKDKVINHIDGNKINNNIDNLEEISYSENVLHAQYVLNASPKIRSVYKYDLNGNFLEKYASCAEAARKNEGCYPNLISNVCNGKKKTHHGFIWKYE